MHEHGRSEPDTSPAPAPSGAWRLMGGSGFRVSALLALVAGSILTTAAARERDDADGLRARLEAAESALTARSGELALARLELNRLEAVTRASARHDIPADLAAAIHDIAVAEGIEPELAFSLVAVESRFAARAISSVGAIGLTQVMPSTADGLEPGISIVQLMDERTNLRLGFRYLRQMIRQYDGDLRLALLAYNRGPATVDSIRRLGGDPSNGYATRVLRGRRGD